MNEQQVSAIKDIHRKLRNQVSKVDSLVDDMDLIAPNDPDIDRVVAAAEELMLSMGVLGLQLESREELHMQAGAEQHTRKNPGPKPELDNKLGEIKWITVQDLIKVWQNSPYAKMKPPSSVFGTQSIITLDSEYAALTEAQATLIITDTDVDQITWSSEKTDCDNISRYMAASVSIEYGVNAVGVVDGIDQGHSHNVFILTDGDRIYFRAFEPQTDQWRSDDDVPKVGWVHFC